MVPGTWRWRASRPPRTASVRIPALATWSWVSRTRPGSSGFGAAAGVGVGAGLPAATGPNVGNPPWARRARSAAGASGPDGGDQEAAADGPQDEQGAFEHADAMGRPAGSRRMVGPGSAGAFEERARRRRAAQPQPLGGSNGARPSRLLRARWWITWNRTSAPMTGRGHGGRAGGRQCLRMGLRVVGKVPRPGPVGTMAVVVVVVPEPVVGMGGRAIAARVRDQRHDRGRDQHECREHRQEPPDPTHPRRHASTHAATPGPRIPFPHPTRGDRMSTCSTRRTPTSSSA